MKNKKNTGLHRVWLILSVLLAAVTLFGAMYWGPQHISRQVSIGQFLP